MAVHSSLKNLAQYLLVCPKALVLFSLSEAEKSSLYGIRHSYAHTLLFDGTMLQLRSYLICTYHLQLGAGTSLPGLVAAKVGADVTLTDIAKNTEVSSNSNPS